MPNPDRNLVAERVPRQQREPVLNRSIPGVKARHAKYISTYSLSAVASPIRWVSDRASVREQEKRFFALHGKRASVQGEGSTPT